MGLWNVKQLSEYLKIKSSTLYAWAAHGKIPCLKIHRLIRFQKEEIDNWLESLRREKVKIPSINPTCKGERDIDSLIARAKREVYNTQRGETRPMSGPGKGVK